ncbi:hypothetical protein [Methanoculleus sp.]|uniref:hypothetical protein n=1 Tax=Methanoculleus sp. TaxID=90427 RepID=UPI0025D2B504|nr:hypothetical protein [Methanoculleus sp.]
MKEGQARIPGILPRSSPPAVVPVRAIEIPASILPALRREACGNGQSKVLNESFGIQ